MPILGAQHGGTRGLRLGWPALHLTGPGPPQCLPAGPAPHARWSGLGRLGRGIFGWRTAGSAMETRNAGRLERAGLGREVGHLGQANRLV